MLCKTKAAFRSIVLRYIRRKWRGVNGKQVFSTHKILFKKQSFFSLVNLPVYRTSFFRSAPSNRALYGKPVIFKRQSDGEAAIRGMYDHGVLDPAVYSKNASAPPAQPISAAPDVL